MSTRRRRLFQSASFALDWVSNNGLPLLRRNPAGIGQIYLMVKAAVRKIILIAVIFDVSVHDFHRCGLIVERPVVHDLHAKALVNRKEFCYGAIELFLPGCFFRCPSELFACHEIREPDNRDLAKRGFVAVVNAVDALLPPKALQRRHYVVEVAFDPMAAHFAHLDGVGY